VEILLTLFYFIIFCWIIHKIPFFKDAHIPRHWYIIVFGVKLLFGIILTIIYTYYYTDRNTADIYKYFDDSKVMFDAFFTNKLDFLKMLFGLDNNTPHFDNHYYHAMNFWYRPYNGNIFSDSHVIIRLNTILRFFSFGYFEVHNVFINFISLLGFTALYKAFKEFVSSKKILFYILFFIPSVVFWSSGLLKEGIIFFGLGFLIYYFIKIIKQFKWKYLLFIFAYIMIINYTKFYLLALLIIPIFGYAFNLKANLNKPLLGYFLVTFVCIIITTILAIINPYNNIITHIIDKQESFNQTIALVKANSSFLLPKLTDTFSILINIPTALINVLLRPYLWESHSALMLVYATENILILGFIIFCLLFRKKQIFNKNIFWFNFIFAIQLFILIGLTTPVFGSIVRYKIPGVIFLMIALSMILDIEKINLKMPFLKKMI